MAVSNVLAQATGTKDRSAMCQVDMDGNATFAIGTAIGATIQITDKDGVDVDAAAVRSYTSTAVLTGEELMEAWAASISAALSGANAHVSKNSEIDQMVLHVKPSGSHQQGGWNAILSLPTFVPA